MEWEASPAGDAIADSVVALIMHAQSSAASIRLTSKPCRHGRDSISDEDVEDNKKLKADDVVGDRLRFVRSILLKQFEFVEACYEGCTGTYEIVTDCGLDAGVPLEEGKLHCRVTVEFDESSASCAKITVECPDRTMASNIQATIRSAITAAEPIESKP